MVGALRLLNEGVEVEEGGTVSTKVTMVCPPAATVTVVVPAARLLLTSDPACKVLTDVSVVPGGTVSVISTGPAGTTIGAPALPPGAGPAGTVTVVPPTLNVKLVPGATPAPAMLQICRKPEGTVRSSRTSRVGL